MNVRDFSAKTIDHQQISLSQYLGSVILIVNVASKCGFTKQYAGLQALYQRYHASGLVILGFPCDQFGHQEPGDELEIKQFCTLAYDVSFPLFAKIEVNGVHADPLYQWLKSSRPGLLGTQAIKWNFTKFLLNRTGEVVARYAPTTTPESLQLDIETALNAAQTGNPE
jgi:glutathione peroxidase